MPSILAEQQLLAHCYAAEALCNLESPQQAAEQLQAAVALQDDFGISSMQEAARAGGDVGTDSHVSATCPLSPWPWLLSLLCNSGIHSTPYIHPFCQQNLQYHIRACVSLMIEEHLI